MQRRVVPAVIGLFVMVAGLAASTPAVADEIQVLTDTFTVTNAATEETVATTVIPAQQFAAGTTLDFSYTFRQYLPGSSGRFEVVLQPGNVVLDPPSVGDFRLEYSFTIPAGLDPSLTYTLIARTAAGGTTELAIYRFFSYSFRVEGATGGTPLVAPSETTASVAQPATSSVAESPTPDPTPASSSTAVAAAAPLPVSTERMPAPDWPWILLVSALGAGVLVGFGAMIVRRINRNRSYRRLASRD